MHGTKFSIDARNQRQPIAEHESRNLGCDKRGPGAQKSWQQRQVRQTFPPSSNLHPSSPLRPWSNITHYFSAHIFVAYLDRLIWCFRTPATDRPCIRTSSNQKAPDLFIMAEVSSTRLYLGNLPRDGRHLQNP